jgi:hypothetical protein
VRSEWAANPDRLGHNSGSDLAAEHNAAHLRRIKMIAARESRTRAAMLLIGMN